MIIKGDIFNTTMQWKVNPVNCVGVMGKGLALEFKKRYPAMFKKYQEICKLGLLRPGKLWAWNNEVLCFPTKDHWRNHSKTEYIEEGLDKFLVHYKRLGITSIAFPALGCNNGGLKKEIIIPLMQSYLNQAENLEYEIWYLD